MTTERRNQLQGVVAASKQESGCTMLAIDSRELGELLDAYTPGDDDDDDVIEEVAAPAHATKPEWELNSLGFWQYLLPGGWASVVVYDRYSTAKVFKGNGRNYKRVGSRTFESNDHEAAAKGWSTRKLKQEGLGI